MIWQKRARLVVAVSGIACLALVYISIDRRPDAAPQPALHRLDPTAVFESTSGRLQQVRGVTKDYDIQFDKQLTYADGSSKLFGVTIRVQNRGGRDFIVHAQQALAGKDEAQLLLDSGVQLQASDGFRLNTDRAVFSEDEGIVRADGPVTFSSGRTNGSGTGMSYDQASDVLRITSDAHVATTDDRGGAAMEFTAGSAMLDRVQDVLTLDGAVHVLRGEQVMEATTARAQLSGEGEFVTSVFLAGSARVAGGSASLDSMSAGEIDLDYGDRGQALERVVMKGSAAVAMKNQNGASGRQITGDTLDLQFALDETLSGAQGRGHVGMALPATDGAAARRVRADALDAIGEPGSGLTDVHFAGAVEYREDPEEGDAPRIARSHALTLGLRDRAIDGATFTGDVVFEEQGLRAMAAEARYAPDAGVLDLRRGGGPVGESGDAGSVPCVADDRMAIEAASIGVTLAEHRIIASGGVKATLLPRTSSAHGALPRCGLTGRATPDTRRSDPRDRDQSTRLPGLLKQDQSASVSAETLEYSGDGGRATFAGHATLVQGDTAIRADLITIDQQRGDLHAVGSARSRVPLDDGIAIGAAHEIRYDDQRGAIAYVAQSAETSTSVDPSRGRPSLPLAHLAGPGPNDDLQAGRIEMVLAAEGGALDRLEAHVSVRAAVGQRVATGTRLTYRAASGQYDLVGTALAPVRIVDGCRAITGKTLTFFRTTDRIIVDGDDEIVTRTTRGVGPCLAAPAPSH